MRRLTLIVAAAAAALALAAPAAAHDATCSGVLGTEVHGQHVVGMYVVGGQLALETWPPTGGVGQAIAGRGAALPGGPGPAFHMPNEIAPGASFCTDSSSPGAHW